MCHKCHSKKHRYPKKIDACTIHVSKELSVGSNTYVLRQCDFITGSYRIRNPGTYVLAEDIVFNPPYGSASKRPDTPLTGFWFAAITVECDNVVIDGNNFTISVSPAYIAANAVGTFADILLGNNQFTGVAFDATAGVGARFPDTTEYIASNNVSIKNLKIVGNSSHFGIMGNNNDNIYIDNCKIADCQVANGYFQSPQTLSITNTAFTGSVTPITVNMENAQLILMRQQYAKLIANNVVGAAAQLAALEAYILANPGRFITSQQYPTSLYGLFIVPGPTAVFLFPMNSENVPFIASIVNGSRNGRYCENINVNNCTFTDFISSANEIVNIGTNQPLNLPLGVPFLSWVLGFFGLFGSIQWKDAYDNTGAFNPNAFLQSLVFLMNYHWNIPDVPTQFFPANSQDIFNSILAGPSGEALFNTSAAPIVSNQSDGTVAKGLFGMRIIAAQNLTVNNIKMTNFHTSGPAPIDPSTLPGYANIVTPQPISRSRGNDAWFVSSEVCTNANLSNFDMDGLVTDNGYAFGVHSAEEDSNITISISSLKNISAPNTIITPVMDAGDVNGFTADNNTGGIILQNLTTQNLVGGGTITPFASPSSTIALINTLTL